MVSPHHHSKHLHWHHISVKVPICQPPHSDLLHNAGNYKTKGYRVFLYWFSFQQFKYFFQRILNFKLFKVAYCNFKIISEKKLLRDTYELFPGWYLGFASAPLSNRNLTASWLSLLQKKEESINHNIFIKIIYLQIPVCYQFKFCNSYAYSVICSVRILLIKISCSFSLKKNPFAKSLQ